MENKTEDKLMSFKGELSNKTRQQIIDACSHLQSSDRDIIDYIYDVALNPRKYSDEQYWKGLCRMAQQKHSDTWDAGYDRAWWITDIDKDEKKEPPTKEEYLNHLFPTSGVKAEE